MKVLWCITGAGHLLSEVLELMEKKAKEGVSITSVFSDAGFEVCGMYNILDNIREISDNIIIESGQGKSFPFCGKIVKGIYDVILIAPATANTVAKIRFGIADSLVTNIAGQALKANHKVCALPTDLVKFQKTRIPSGRLIDIQMRDVDMENARALEKMGIKIFEDVEDIEKCEWFGSG